MSTPSITQFFTPPKRSIAERLADEEIGSISPPSSRKRKRGNYSEYSPEQRMKIARYAIENGNTAAAKHFSKVLSKSINESTVRGMKTSYLKFKKFGAELGSKLPKSPRGRPLKLGHYDSDVCDYIRNLRETGGVVNKRIVVAAAKGILLAKDKTLLQEHGGPVELSKAWASSIMKRLGYVKRKGTKGVKSLPSDFDEIKTKFLARIGDARKEFNIPEALVINWDQTGSNFVPVGDWTMAEEGSKQVPIKAMDDKRQMTVLLGCTMSGHVLPPQLLYQGKTEQCHPVYNFPKDWDIYHSETHWSNAHTMERYVERVIVPYIENIKEEMDLPVRQRALCIFDVYKAHRGEELRELLKSKRIQCVYVPACCTDQLQPLDLAPNGVFKHAMKSCFEDWYAEECAAQLIDGSSPCDINIDLRLSRVKPLHARWLTKSVEKLTPDVIKAGWRKASILD